MPESKKFSFKIDAADVCRKLTLPAKRRSGSGAGKQGTGVQARGTESLAEAHGFGLVVLTHYTLR